MSIKKYRAPIQTFAGTCGRERKPQQTRRDLEAACSLTAAHSLFSARGAFARDEETKELSSASLTKIDAALMDATRAQRVPGVVAMAATNGGIIYEGAFGTRELGTDAAMMPDTVVAIASMTKAITSAAAMQLVERGQLTLDTPAADVVTALGQVQVLTGFDASGTPQLRAPRRAMTLKQLLTHTAGFGLEFFNTEIVQYQAATGTPGIITCENAALTTPLLFDPGER